MASPPVSPSLTRTTSATDSTGHLTPTSAWTSEQEARLTYCQDQLKQAQKKWSDRQELWIREVEHLLEQKRSHKKAQKKRKAYAEKALRKARTWRPLSRTQSSVTASAPGTLLDDDDDDDDVYENDGDDASGLGLGLGLGGGVERSESLPLQSSLPSSSPTSPTPTTQTTQSTGRNPFKKMIRRMSSANFRGSRGRRNSSVAEAAEGSGSRNEV